MLKLLLLSVLVFGPVNPSDISFYEILSVSKQASTQEIRQAYKKLAVKFHPDKNPGASEQEKFLKITEAYETLKDPEKRRNYDIYGTYQTYSKKYDYKSQAEYDNLYYKGLYHEDTYVDTLSGASFYNYLKEGFYFINFYSPFCPPCQNVADDWKKLAKLYKGIIKVGAVNCKYHNSFCYNSMRIGSYPSLLFYPNGKRGNYIYYRGERTLEALENFVMTYLSNQVHVPTIFQLRSTDKPMVYVLKVNNIDRNVITRIAFHLTGLATVVIVDDDNLREKLTSDEYTTIVFKYKSTTKEIESSDEDEILKEIIEALPSVQLIGPEKLKEIRNQLRNYAKTPWVFYFSSKGESNLQLHQMRTSFPNMHFGNIDCEKWNQLCASLHVDTTPAWGVMKEGGGYQRAYTDDIKDFINTATKATSLHTLSTSDFKKILDGDVGVWVLLVVPYDSKWDEFIQPFTDASLHFNNDEEVSFGIMVCTLNTDDYCRQVAPNQVTILVQNGTKRHTYNGRTTSRQLFEYIHMLRDSAGLELDEQKVLEVLDSSRSHTWLVAYLPAHCGRVCEQLAYEWMLVANKLRPLDFVRVGVLQCERTYSTFCNNVRIPTVKLYPLLSGQHYSANLQNLAQAPYILEWALQFIDDSVEKINWQSFTRTVIAEELNPTSGKKPWLIYFHSPRCYRCYEMYADFAIAGILLNNAIQLGKVNCINERGLCQHEQINNYPSLKLYLNRNQHQSFSSVISIQVRDYNSLLEEIKPLLMKYDRNLLASVDNLRKGFSHDEF